MIKILLKIAFVIGFTLVGTLLIALLRSLIPRSGTGFDGLANFLGWVMASAAISFAISLYLVRQLHESQIKIWVIALSIIILIGLGLFYYKTNKAQKELPTTEQPTTKPITPETDQ